MPQTPDVTSLAVRVSESNVRVCTGVLVLGDAVASVPSMTRPLVAALTVWPSVVRGGSPGARVEPRITTVPFSFSV